MKRAFFVVVLALLLVATASSFALAAETPATVQINGVLVTYQNVQPVNIDGRVMVPIRETAENLGLTVNWDDATRTMTFNRGSDVIRHTINSSTISVNGVARPFDTPSIIKNGYSLMPVRMLAEAIGAEITWDGTNQRVVVTTNSSGGPAIISATPNKMTYMAGETVTVTVLANSSTTMVQLVSTTMGNVGSSSIYTESSGNRTFTVVFTAARSTTAGHMIMVSAGNANGYQANSDKFFVISVDEAEVDITDFDISETSVDYNDEIEIYVYTETGATKVWIEDPDKKTLDSTTSHDKYDDEYEWFLSFDAKKSGTYTIYSQGEGDNTDSEKVKITVDGVSGNISVELNPSNGRVYDGDEVEVTVYTDTDIDSVWIDDPDGYKVANDSSPRSSSGEYQWDMSFDADIDGTYTVYAENEDGDTIKITFKITFR